EDDSLLVKAIEILENGKIEAENASIKPITGDFYLALMDSYPLLKPPVHRYDLAQKAIDLGKDINDHFLMYQGYLGQSHMYFYEERYYEALEVRPAMEAVLKKLNNPVYRRSFNNINYEVSKALDRNREALYYLEQLKVLNDSILDVERTSQFNEIVEKYENEKKEKEILSLSDEKEKLLIQNELNASKVRVRNLWIGVLALFGLAGISLVYLFQRQKRTNAEKKSLQIEQQLLRAQMNPHFIFNSLNGIKRFYVEGRTEDANDFLADFSKLLRTILDRSDKTEVNIDEEIEFLRLYLELEKRRLNDKLDYKIDYNPDDFDYDDIIPSFIIQPLVENAIWHGIQKKQGHGMIEVRVFKKDHEILIEVMDNGIGLNQKVQSRGLHKSRGLKLIRERLGKKGILNLHDLSSTNEEYNGTLATLNIQLD
ncbi:MAG: histidine kinase, partial [Bacteroidia bacterium]|nr:histidine kinase [Bacteroidia bacterium]